MFRINAFKKDVENKISILRERIKELEKDQKKEPVIAEVCVFLTVAEKCWYKLTQDDILDEVDGCVKIKFSTYRYLVVNIIGLRGPNHPEHQHGFNIKNTCWVKKDCLIWHNKDKYAKERKMIEDKREVK